MLKHHPSEVTIIKAREAIHLLLKEKKKLIFQTIYKEILILIDNSITILSLLFCNILNSKSRIKFMKKKLIQLFNKLIQKQEQVKMQMDPKLIKTLFF